MLIDTSYCYNVTSIAQVLTLAEHDHGGTRDINLANMRINVLLSAGHLDAAWRLFEQTTGWTGPRSIAASDGDSDSHDENADQDDDEASSALQRPLAPRMPRPTLAAGRRKRQPEQPTLLTYLPILRNVTTRFTDTTHAAEVTLSIFRHMQRWHHVRPDTMAYSVAIAALTDANRGEKAHDLYQQMRAERVPPSSRIFENLFRWFGRVGRMDRVDALYEDLLVTGIRPSAQLSNVLINVCRMEPLSVVLGAAELDRAADAKGGLAPAPAAPPRRSFFGLIGGRRGPSGRGAEGAGTSSAGDDDDVAEGCQPSLRPALERLGLPSHGARAWDAATDGTAARSPASAAGPAAARRASPPPAAGGPPSAPLVSPKRLQALTDQLFAKLSEDRPTL